MPIITFANKLNKFKGLVLLLNSRMSHLARKYYQSGPFSAQVGQFVILIRGLVTSTYPPYTRTRSL
jgi:hypothetical protein